MTSPRLHFVSLCDAWVEEMRAHFKSDTNVRVLCDDIQNIPLRNTVIVSPANSLGFMDGGIDKTLSRDMFPGLEAVVQARIYEHGVTNAFGRYFLPVGSACCVTMDSAIIIVAPTMFQPMDVSYTQNAYWSFLAALMLFDKLKKHDDNLCMVVTSHCCGYGRMNPTESAKQMRTAYEDFCVDAVPPDAAAQLDSTVILPTPDEPNPWGCDMSETKEIVIS